MSQREKPILKMSAHSGDTRIINDEFEDMEDSVKYLLGIDITNLKVAASLNTQRDVNDLIRVLVVARKQMPK